MIRKLLIANRGEIACRVMATAQRMGIATVAVYSKADAASKHVAMADEAVLLGPAPASESYLRADRIIAAARCTGADAVHPGYGFLSENPAFAEALAANSFIFVGPPASAIRAMGLKDAAKALMQKAGVPVVPGYHGDNQDPAFLAKQAQRIGYPVLIKARAGGGGKGMRLVENPAQFADALQGAQREAQASFGDPVCLIEKFVTQPRHVEIQVFGDQAGNVVHLFERDCSLQRRHQKVIEEAPAPGMPETVRAAMGRAAVEAAKAIGYQGAGTVEFIADSARGLREDGFWFMEMNTRLQVEHPVSEAITGLDFVELQLRIAAGEPLPFAQDDLSIQGHAFEARVYAEDVPKGFLPAIGKLDHLSFPAGSAFAHGAVRIDSGVRSGDSISTHYDPMIAKVIVHGASRDEALLRLHQALMDTHVAGLTTNVAFLTALTAHAGFAAGAVDTGLIGRDLEQLAAVPDPDSTVWAMAALAGLDLLHPRGGTDPWESLTGWRHWHDATQTVVLEHQDSRHALTVTSHGDGTHTVQHGETKTTLAVVPKDQTTFAITREGQTMRLALVRSGHTITVFHAGHAFAFHEPNPLDAVHEAEDGDGTVTAPMPGLVKVLSSTAGQTVAKGDPLLVLEAMKMEHTLSAPRDGVIAAVFVAEGDQVTHRAHLLALEPEADD